MPCKLYLFILFLFVSNLVFAGENKNEEQIQICRAHLRESVPLDISNDGRLVALSASEAMRLSNSAHGTFSISFFTSNISESELQKIKNLAQQNHYHVVGELSQIFPVKGVRQFGFVVQYIFHPQHRPNKSRLINSIESELPNLMIVAAEGIDTAISGRSQEARIAAIIKDIYADQIEVQQNHAAHQNSAHQEISALRIHAKWIESGHLDRYNVQLIAQKLENCHSDTCLRLREMLENPTMGRLDGDVRTRGRIMPGVIRRVRQYIAELLEIPTPTLTTASAPATPQPHAQINEQQVSQTGPSSSHSSGISWADVARVSSQTEEVRIPRNQNQIDFLEFARGHSPAKPTTRAKPVDISLYIEDTAGLIRTAQAMNKNHDRDGALYFTLTSESEEPVWMAFSQKYAETARRHQAESQERFIDDVESLLYATSSINTEIRSTLIRIFRKWSLLLNIRQSQDSHIAVLSIHDETAIHNHLTQNQHQALVITDNSSVVALLIPKHIVPVEPNRRVLDARPATIFESATASELIDVEIIQPAAHIPAPEIIPASLTAEDILLEFLTTEPDEFSLPNHQEEFVNGIQNFKTDSSDLRTWARELGYRAEDIIRIKENIQTALELYGAEGPEALVWPTTELGRALMDFVNRLERSYTIPTAPVPTLSGPQQQGRAPRFTLSVENYRDLLLAEGVSHEQLENLIILNEVFDDAKFGAKNRVLLDKFIGKLANIATGKPHFGIVQTSSFKALRMSINELYSYIYVVHGNKKVVLGLFENKDIQNAAIQRSGVAEVLDRRYYQFTR